MASVGVSGRSVGELRRLIGEAQARGETALARRLELDLTARMRQAAARRLNAQAGIGASHADLAMDGYAYEHAPPELAAPYPASPLAAALREPARAGAVPGGRAWQLAAAAVAGAALAGVAAWWLTSADVRPAQRTAPAQAVETPPAALPPATPTPPAIPAPIAPSPALIAAPSAPHRPAACRAPATPGQRAVCASPSLLTQDQRLTRAYQHALAAGANRPSLDRAQAHWRQLRNQTDSPARLAQLYRTRIAALDAAARHAHGKARHRAKG